MGFSIQPLIQRWYQTQNLSTTTLSHILRNTSPLEAKKRVADILQVSDRLVVAEARAQKLEALIMDRHLQNHQSQMKRKRRSRIRALEKELHQQWKKINNLRSLVAVLALRKNVEGINIYAN